MSTTMKWFICCLVVIFFGIGFLIGTYVTITVHVVQDQIDEYHRANLLLLYEVKEDIEWL